MEEDPSLPDLSVRGLEWLGAGISGLVFALDDHTVLKKAPTSANLFCERESLLDHVIERSIYERLGHHPRICEYKYPVRRGLVLERLKGPLRARLVELANRGETPSHEQALKWSIHAAEGLAYTHQRAVLQADVGCHNLLLDQHDNVKLCDFAGSSIDGKPATVCYQLRSQSAIDTGQTVTVQSELFALGSTIYEIWTSRQPYQDETDDAVRRYYEDQRFPDLEGLPPAEIIKKCWFASYSSAMDVVADLKLLNVEKAGMHKEKDDGTGSVLERVVDAIQMYKLPMISAVILAIMIRTRSKS